jgi:hypothetical protein
MQRVNATIRQGYRVASGQALAGADQRFNEDGGTIHLQIPEFKKRGLDFDEYFEGLPGKAYVVGTLGCDISPYVMHILRPEYHFVDVRWTEKFDHDIPGFKENFFLSPAAVEFAGSGFKALLYIPDPATKPDHFHPPSTIEVIAQKIPNVTYGDRVILSFNPAAIRLEMPKKI